MLPDNQIAGLFKIYFLKEEVNEEVYFWHADKHQSFLQVEGIILGDAINFGVHSQATPKYSK